MSTLLRAAHPRLIAFAVLLLAATGLTPGARAASCHAEPPAGHPVVGLALGGGGARGFAHVGVLKYLEEQRIPYYRIAGTSMGSIVGGFAAAGMTSVEITDLVERTDWTDVFSDTTARQDLPQRRKQDDLVGLYGPKFGIGKGDALLPAGVVAGQKILVLFEGVAALRTQSHDFDQLPVPYRAIATDIISGELVIMNDLPLALAMRASMSVPGAFDPVRVGDRLLVDGGLVRNLPLDVVRELGADVVVAVDVGTPLRTADDIGNVLTIMDQMTGLAIAANSAAQIATLGERDVLIRPDLGNDITSSSFEQFEEAFILGYEAAREKAAKLAPLSLPEDEYVRWRASLDACVSGAPVLHFVRLNNQSRFSDAVIREMIHFEPGQPLDTDRLDRDMRQIHGLGFVRVASYNVVEEDGRQGLEVLVLQDERGTDFIETGLSIAASGRGAVINLQAGYLKTDLDERGSEFRAVVQFGDDQGILTDVFKYLDDSRNWNLNPYAAISRRNQLVYDDPGRAIGSVRISEVGGGVRIGREFGRYAMLAVGLRASSGEVEVDIGNPESRLEFDGGELTVNATWDRLDDLYLPTRGARVRLDYYESADWLGADEDYSQLLFSAVASKTWGAHNLLLTGRYNVTLDGATPVYALFTGGGFLNMSGFEPNELVGQNYGMVGAGYRYRVLDEGFLPGYVGGTVEYGNATELKEDLFSDGTLNGSLYFAYDTPLGPLYAGWGWNAERRGLVFLRLGAIIGAESLGRR